MKSASGLLLCALLLPGLACAQDGTFTPDWDIRPVLKEIAAHAGRLAEALDKLNTAAWVSKGAPDAYPAQVKSTRAQAVALSGDALALSNDPEKLPDALKAFFRLQSVEFTLGSLENAARKYQTAAAADSLTSLAAENGANRERFQQYIVELARRRDEEYQIMDHEAQRCRESLSRQAPTARKGK
jgi:hypothetical protein